MNRISTDEGMARLCDDAKIGRCGLVQVVISAISPQFLWYVARNGEMLEYLNLVDLMIDIQAPSGGIEQGKMLAHLTYKAKNATGKIEEVTDDLFPAAIDIVMCGDMDFTNGRRLTICNAEKDNLERTWVTVGVDANGVSRQVYDMKGVMVLISPPLLEARITKTDGSVEHIFNENLNLIN